MGGCSSKTATEPTAKPTDAKPIETLSEEHAPVLTQASAEERALTQLKLIFESVDTNKDGGVSKTELVAALDKDANLGALIKEAGLDQDYNVLEKLDTMAEGCVTWDEFYANLKKVAVTEVLESGNVSAVDLPADQKAVQQLKKVFESMDANADGAVSNEELAAALDAHENIGKLVKEAGLNPQYYVLEQLDTNQDGQITWDEFELHLRGAAKEEVKATGGVAAGVEAALFLESQEESGKDEVDGKVAPSGCIWCGW